MGRGSALILPGLSRGLWIGGVTFMPESSCAGGKRVYAYTALSWAGGTRGYLPGLSEDSNAKGYAYAARVGTGAPGCEEDGIIMGWLF